MLSPPLRIAASRNSSATVGCPLGPPAAPCSPTCSPTKPTIAAKFLCSPTNSATASSTKLPTSGNGKNSGNKPASPPAPANRNPPSWVLSVLLSTLLFGGARLPPRQKRIRGHEEQATNPASATPVPYPST